MFSSLILFSLINYAFALPSGSPICRKNSEFTNNHGSKPTPDAPFKATALVVKDLEASVKIEGPFKGMLLYASKVGGNQNVGSFDKPSGFNYVSGCGGSSSTLTHASDATKSATSFTWTAPEAGSYVITVILTGGKTPWNEFNINIDVGNQSAALASKDAQAPKAAEKQVTKHMARQADTVPTDSSTRKCRQKVAGY